jgi:cytochrome c oxidase subunit 2
MWKDFPLFPEQASTIAAGVDSLYLFLIGISVFFSILIFTLIFCFAIIYRRRSEDERPKAIHGSMSLELFWSGVPLVLAMIMFGWGASLYFTNSRAPEGAMELHVVGKQWMWKIQHPGGRSEINELHVPTGRPIRMRMISEDVIHSFYIPAFRVKQDVLPGRYSTLWFEPTRPGEYYLFCAEYCGTDHANMSGRVHVMQPADYAAWLSGSTADLPPVVGEKLFTQFRCHTCHHEGAEPRCPPLKGLFGTTVALADGRTVPADDSYLRESIVNPLAKVAAGFQPVMPTYQGQLTEQQVFQLIEYIKSLPAASGKNDPS